MQKSDVSPLFDRDKAIHYYEKRYAEGYMEHYWTAQHKQRISEVVAALALAPEGEALDFGCGNGELTDILRQALPVSWKVYGVDFSAEAINRARQQYPQCAFLPAGDSKLAGRKFDLLFSNHVLEHVSDLPATFSELDSYLKPACMMLHILPCANPGSFEHSLCLLRRDGINPSFGNRFYLEDVSHLRRLTTDQLTELCAGKGFTLIREIYENHFFGAINWITRDGPSYVSKVIDPSAAVDKAAAHKLRRIRRVLYPISLLRYLMVRASRTQSEQPKNWKTWVLIVARFPLYWLVKPMDCLLSAMDRREWRKRKTERNGSAMFLVFDRRD
jgi:cyclopropane fatty-acyl-phospholipid synthase-like methyltransferase